MAGKLDAAAEQAEFTALLAELDAPDTDDGEEPAAEETPEPELEDEPEAEEDEPADEEDEPEAQEDELEAPAGLSKGETEAAKLLKAGNVKEACKRLGIDPKLLKVNPREFTAMRKGLADAEKLSREGSAAQAAGEKLRKDAESVYGPIVAGFKAYREGNPMQLRAAIELMCEDSLENAVATMARAAKGLDPAQVEVLKLRKELKDREEAQRAETEKQTAAAAATQEVATIAGKLKDTPLAKIPGAAQEIYDLVRGSYKPGTGYGLTVKEAYTQVKAKHAAIAEAFGKKPAVKGTKPNRTPLETVRKPAAKLTAADRKAAEDAEFMAVLKEAKAATAAGARRNGRTK
jgi:hypothetical protein